MRHAETVVPGHFNTPANQVALAIRKQQDIQELQRRASDAGYDADAGFDLAFEPWLRDDNFVFDDNCNDWGLIGLDPEKVYPTLLQVPFSNSVQLLIFAVNVQHLPRDNWKAELSIYHIADLGYPDEDYPIFEYSNHCDTPLTIQVDMARCGDELTFADGLGIECLDAKISSAVRALSSLLQGRANSISDAGNVEYLM